MIKPKTDDNKSFVRGALTLTIGLFLAKIFGAIYRIPLTNMLGTYGIGVYQLIFPLYALFLTVATAGIPTAISKAIAEKLAVGTKQEAIGIFKASLLFLGGIGTISGILLFVCAEILGGIQRNADTVTAYRIISASIPLCAVSAGFRGFFNGTLNMKPSSISQIIEQTVKLTFGLIGVALCLPDVVKAVYAATLAITISEAINLLIMAIWFRKSTGSLSNVSIKGTKPYLKSLARVSVPITMTAIILPFLHFADSFLFQNLLKAQNATELYGLWSGPVHSLISMPFVLTTGIASAILPVIAKAVTVKDYNRADSNLSTAMKMAFTITLPAAVGLMLLAKPIGALLYPSLSVSELNTFSTLLQLAAPGVVAMTVLMITSSALQAYGSTYVPVFSLLCAVAVKLILGAITYSSAEIGIFGESISDSAAYTVACFVNLWYSLYVRKCKIELWQSFIYPLSATCVMSVFIVVMTAFFGAFVMTTVGTIITLLGAVAMYALTTMLSGFISPSSVLQYLKHSRAQR